MNVYVIGFLIYSPIMAVIFTLKFLLYDTRKIKPKYCLTVYLITYIYTTCFMMLLKFLKIQRPYNTWGTYVLILLIIFICGVYMLHCHQRKKNEALTPKEDNIYTKRDWLTKEESEAFIGENSVYYLDTWKSYFQTFYKGVNLSALVFGINWMAYRKMYLGASLLGLAQITSIRIILMFDIDGGIVMFYVIHIIIGTFANTMYRRKAIRALRKTYNMKETERLMFLTEKGGVSVPGVIICFVLEFVYVFLLLFISSIF